MPHDQAHNFDPSCDTFDCEVKYVHTHSCVTYSHLSLDFDCAIPCHLSNCTKRILHKWTMCPIWRCTTHDDPLTPALPLNHPMSIATIVLSLLGTILMTLFITLAVIIVLRRLRRSQHQELRTNSNSPIVGKKERIFRFQWGVSSR